MTETYALLEQIVTSVMMALIPFSQGLQPNVLVYCLS